MARSLTPRDCHALMNQLVKQATGQQGITVVDSSTFASAGELVLGTGLENVLDSLSIVLGRTFMAVRPYNAKLQIINALNTNMYTNRLRKISFYSRNAQASGDFNTQLYTNLANGFDNGSNPDDGTPQSTASMWEQNAPIPLEMNFAGSSTWEDSTTIYEYQLKVAFRSEAEFGEFVSGIMTEKGNDIESQKEAFNRMCILNYIAGLYDMNSTGTRINVTNAFNQRYGTNYTSAELRNEHTTDFLEFFVSLFKITSDYMTNRSANYHWSPDKEDAAGNDLVILRHTPKDRQRFLYFSPLFTEAKTKVFPEIFNPQYLNLEAGEGVTYWQSINTPTKINVTPAIPDKSTGIQTAGDNVELEYVIGVLYDVDAMMIDYQLDTAATTPLEARKHYRNMWWSFAKNAINDFTENGIIFYMADNEPIVSNDNN